VHSRSKLTEVAGKRDFRQGTLLDDQLAVRREEEHAERTMQHTTIDVFVQMRCKHKPNITERVSIQPTAANGTNSACTRLLRTDCFAFMSDDVIIEVEQDDSARKRMDNAVSDTPCGVPGKVLPFSHHFHLLRISFSEDRINFSLAHCSSEQNHTATVKQTALSVRKTEGHKKMWLAHQKNVSIST
jgi:hypothetical protein